MANDRYDFKVDVYSFGICLVAMVRCEADVVKFFFEGLRKHLKMNTMAGIGIGTLNGMMRNNFRPKLPVRLYPALTKLIQECWQNNPESRPTFDDIVARLGGEITAEVGKYHEPDILAEDGAAEEEEIIETGVPELRENVGDSDSIKLISLRKELEAERAKLAAELSSSASAQAALERQIDAEHKRRIELENLLQAYEAKVKNATLFGTSTEIKNELGAPVAQNIRKSMSRRASLNG